MIFNKTIHFAEDFQVKLSGFGISLGRDVYVDKQEGKLYGGVVDKAFHIGENLTEKNVVIVTGEVKQAIEGLPAFFSLCEKLNAGAPPTNEQPSFSFEPFGLSESDHKTLGNCFKLSATLPPVFPPNNQPNSNPKINHILKQLEIVEQNPTNRDEQIKILRNELQSYIKSSTVVMMYGCAHEVITQKFGIGATLLNRKRIDNIVEKVIHDYGGVACEATIIQFKSVSDAVLAALKLRDEVFTHNLNHEENEKIPFKGNGIHIGDVLSIGPFENWGDPINTASKLSEDIAQYPHMNTYTTNEAFSHIKPSLLPHLEYEQQALKTDKDTFSTYFISRSSFVLQFDNLFIQTGKWNSTRKYPWNSSRSGMNGFISDRIEFLVPYKSVPIVTLGIQSVDCAHDHNFRINNEVLELDEKGFKVKIGWWGDTHLFSAGVNWTAFGLATPQHH